MQTAERSRTARLPTSDLFDYVAKHKRLTHATLTVKIVATYVGLSARTVYRMQNQGGFTVNDAEDIADNIGVHPTDIWGQDYYRCPRAYLGGHTSDLIEPILALHQQGHTARYVADKTGTTPTFVLRIVKEWATT